jgi:hypothetical protein
MHMNQNTIQMNLIYRDNRKSNSSYQYVGVLTQFIQYGTHIRCVWTFQPTSIVS